MEKVAANLASVAERFVPRLLTQACRDPHAPFYGCFDRNWWHYKIRDFPSAILQQGGYSAHLAGRLEEFGAMSAGLDALAAGSVRFWSQRALRHGAFEEYYPWEQGYPPLAFSTLSAAKLCLHGAVDPESVMPALEVAASQLLSRFEPRAANQQVAGLAALACLRAISPKLVPDQEFASLASRTLALQHSEGWFMEYDGPDLGYLTVTMDCLWDIYDVTGDPRFFESASKAFSYTEWFVRSPFHGAGMHNARNTDYLVPYGLARFAGLGEEWGKRAGDLLDVLYGDTNSPEHFFSAVDDRYVSHYIGHSVIRAILALRGKNTSPLPRETLAPVPNGAGNLSPDGATSHSPGQVGEADDALGFPQKNASCPAGAASATPPKLPTTTDLSPPITTTYFPGSGHWKGGASLLVSGKKGGIFTAILLSKNTISDFGWIVRRPGRDFVSHWWSQEWMVDAQEERIEVRGKMYPHVEHLSTPPKHTVLRMMSFFLGSRLIAWLKSILIFKAGGQHLSFTRSIDIQKNGFIRVEDEICGLDPSDLLIRAPRASKRHVASADSFHREDFLLAPGCEKTESVERSGGIARITTTYRPHE